MTRFNVLDRSLNPLGSHLLEASAGTGKTFAIQHVVVRLLLLGGMTIDQILVVTFTRAATRELKERIRLNLEDLLTSLEKGDSEIDYISAIFERGEDSVRAARENIEAALACFDSAQIFTIHGFCHRMLSEFAFQANVGFGFEDPDDNRHKTSLRESAIDFFRTQLKPSLYGPSQLRSVLNKHKQDFDKLVSRLIHFSQKKGSIEETLNFEELLAAFNDKIQKLPSIHPDLFVEDFELLKTCYKKMTDPDFLKQAKNLAMLLEKKECSVNEFDGLLHDKEFFLEWMEEHNQKVRAKFPDAAHLHYPGFFKQLREEIYSILKSARDPLKIFLRMTRDFRTRWIDSFEHQEKLSHDQILTKMEECLRQRHFCDAVREKYRAAIVDEFQDTDPTQWNIFKTLFVGKLSAVYLVGDPKQSIYGFRNADVYTYLDAVHHIGSGNRLILDTNYRSDPSLVQALNGLFSHAVSSQWLDLPSMNASLTYQEVNCKSGSVDHPFKDGKGNIHFFLAQGQFEKKKNWIEEEIEPKFFFPFIGKEILDLNEKEGIPFQNIAILVRDRFQAAKLQKSLKECGVPSIVKRSGSLPDSEAMVLLQQLLEAVIDPDDFSKIKTVLGGLLIGLPSLQLKLGAENTDLHLAKAAFHELSLNLLNHGFASFFQNFLQSKWEKQGQTILEKLTSREDLTLYRDLRQLAEILIEYQTSALVSPEALLSYLQELSGSDPEEEERLKRRQEEEDESVSIMTIHASKGLEFEIVFALGLAVRLKRDEEAIHVKIEDQDRIIPFDPQNPECCKSLLEQDAEKMRLLYVALTRAKKRVYIPAAFNLDQVDIPLGKSSAIELFLQKLIKSQDLSLSSFLAVLEDLKRLHKITFELLTQDPVRAKGSRVKKYYEWAFFPPPKIQDTQEYIYSFSTLHKNLERDWRDKMVIPEESLKKDFHHLPPSIETGHILHRILEKVLASGEHSSLTSEKLSFYVRKGIERTHLSEWTDVLIGLIERTLNLPLLSTGENFCLNQVSFKEMLPEMEFVFSHDDSLVKGFIDLTFQINGKYYFLDWKSNWLGKQDEDYSLENIEKEMRQNGYFLQAAIYTAALKRYVKLFDIRPFEECFGGAIYVFLRGQAPYHFLPDMSLLPRF